MIKDVEAPEGAATLGDVVNMISSGKAKALSAEADFNFKEEYRAAFQNVVSQFVLDGGTDVDKVLADLDSEFDRIAGN